MRGKVLVVHDDGISEKEFIEKNQLFLNAAREFNIQLSFKSNSDIYTYIDNNSVKCHDTFDTYDYALFFDKDAWLARNLELMGVKVINSSDAIDLCENKANLYQKLAKNNINIPKTAIFPNMTTYSAQVAKKFLDDAIEDLGLPMVIKGFYSDFGKNVLLAKNREDVYRIVDQMQGKQVLLQEFISESAGSDIRMFVIKNKVVASLRRQGVNGDFRSNAGLGGTSYVYIPTYVDEQLAINATKVAGCEFAIVDIFKSINGPVVCEVNTTGNVNNFYKTCKVDIPSLLFKSLK